MPARCANGTRLTPRPNEWRPGLPHRRAFAPRPPGRASSRRPPTRLSKLWLLYGFGLTGRGRVPLTPFLDLVLAWNTGISYGLFRQTGPLGQWALLTLKVIAVALLVIWLVRARSRLSALGARADHRGRDRQWDRSPGARRRDGFRAVSYHRRHLEFQWYVFNLADVAIVAGVIGLLYDHCSQDAAKAP